MSDPGPCGSTATEVKLAAIKFYINGSDSTHFKKPIKLQQEITRCFSGVDLNIKFANLKGNLLKIATDDQVTHEHLSDEWPEDAFNAGITKFIKKSDKIFKISFELDIKVELDNDILSALKDQNINDPIRIKNRSTGELTPFISATVSGQNYDKILSQGIKIGFSLIRISP